MAKQVWIRCKQVVEYAQQVTVTKEEYDTLMEADGLDVEEFDEDSKKAYRIIQSKIDHSEICDTEPEYTDVRISKK